MKDLNFSYVLCTLMRSIIRPSLASFSKIKIKRQTIIVINILSNSIIILRFKINNVKRYETLYFFFLFNY